MQPLTCPRGMVRIPPLGSRRSPNICTSFRVASPKTEWGARFWTRLPIAYSEGLYQCTPPPRSNSRRWPHGMDLTAVSRCRGYKTWGWLYSRRKGVSLTGTFRGRRICGRRTGATSKTQLFGAARSRCALLWWFQEAVLQLLSSADFFACWPACESRAPAISPSISSDSVLDLVAATKHLRERIPTITGSHTVAPVNNEPANY
jgi:hypothetical protein